MNILAIDRSTDLQTVAVARDGVIVGETLVGADSRSGDWPVKVSNFLAAQGLSFAEIDEYLVGQGPGSFAGIRAALAFAQGLALPGAKSVVGLPSAAALVPDKGLMTVVGDARRERLWVIVYENGCVKEDFFLTTAAELASKVPAQIQVVTSDGARIGELLNTMFGARYVGSRAPTAEELLRVALVHPEQLKAEPLPIYLQAAVRS